MQEPRFSDREVSNAVLGTNTSPNTPSLPNVTDTSPQTPSFPNETNLEDFDAEVAIFMQHSHLLPQLEIGEGRAIDPVSKILSQSSF